MESSSNATAFKNYSNEHRKWTHSFSLRLKHNNAWKSPSESLCCFDYLIKAKYLTNLCTRRSKKPKPILIKNNESKYFSWKQLRISTVAISCHRLFWENFSLWYSFGFECVWKFAVVWLHRTFHQLKAIVDIILMRFIGDTMH